MLLSDYINDVQEIIHDSTASVWPLSRVISRINEARLDVARDIHCVRLNVTGLQLIPNTEIYPLFGAVGGAIITSGGSNYGASASVPITFSPAPAGGVTATATGVLTGGVLTAINMTRWGAGYTSVPTITVGGIGAGAAATAVTLFRSNPLSPLVGDPITITKISYIWNGERRQMKYANFTLFDAYARLWVQNFNAPPGIWTHHQQQKLVYIQPPPDQQYQSEWDTIFMPAPLVGMSDLDGDLVDPWQRAVQFGASANLLWKLRNPGPVRDLEQKYDTYVPHIITTTGGIRIPNIYNRNFQRRMVR